MQFHRGDTSDTLSLRTLDNAITNPANDYVALNRDDPSSPGPVVAKKEIPQSPSESSYFSSPPPSDSEWTPDSSSQFSEEEAPLLGTETPPPQYHSHSWSLPALRGLRGLPAHVLPLGERRQPIGDDMLKQDPSAGDDVRCTRRRKRVYIAHILIMITLFIFSTSVFYAIFKTRRCKQSDVLTLPEWTRDCPQDKNHFNYFELDGVQDLELSDGRRSFSGTIKILPSLPQQTADVIIKARRKEKNLRLNVNGGGLKDLSRSSWLKKPATLLPASPKRRGNHCTRSDVTLYFREGLSLNNLHIKTKDGRVQIFSAVEVTNATTISTKSGDIQSHQFFNTRKSYIDSGASSLQGHFKLYDLLSITSTSGSIDVTIDPQEVDKGNPQPAELVIAAQSGSIRLNTPHTPPPPRQYVTSVESRTGTIQGSLIHGVKTVVDAESGSIELDIQPYLFKDEVASTLGVHSKSGLQKINLRGPVSGQLTEMTSSHTTKSGSLVLNYPQEWAGKIKGESSSGSIEVKGHGVNIIAHGQHFVEAEKDKGNSALEFSAESGSTLINFKL